LGKDMFINLNNISDFVINLIIILIFKTNKYKLLRNIMNFVMQDMAGC